MTVKDVKRVDLGIIYRGALFISLLFLILIILVLHFLAPNFNLWKLPFNLLKLSVWLSFDELLTFSVVIIVFSFVFLLYILYRFSVSWRIKCSVSEKRKTDIVQSNIEKIIDESKQKLCTKYDLVETDKFDKYDRLFQKSDSKKLVCDDHFVIYVDGKVSRADTITLYVVLRKLSCPKEKIKKVDNQIEKIITDFEFLS